MKEREKIDLKNLGGDMEKMMKKILAISVVAIFAICLAGKAQCIVYPKRLSA